MPTYVPFHPTKYHQTYRELDSPDLRTELMAPWQAFNMLSQDLKAVTDLLPKKLQGPMGPFIQWPLNAATAMDPFMQGLGDAQVELSRLVEESFNPLEQSIRNPGSLINLNRSPRDDDGLPKTW